MDIFTIRKLMHDINGTECLAVYAKSNIKISKIQLSATCGTDIALMAMLNKLQDGDEVKNEKTFIVYDNPVFSEKDLIYAIKFAYTAEGILVNLIDSGDDLILEKGQILIIRAKPQDAGDYINININF